MTSVSASWKCWKQSARAHIHRTKLFTYSQLKKEISRHQNWSGVLRSPKTLWPNLQQTERNKTSVVGPLNKSYDADMTYRVSRGQDLLSRLQPLFPKRQSRREYVSSQNRQGSSAATRQRSNVCTSGHTRARSHRWKLRFWLTSKNTFLFFNGLLCSHDVTLRRMVLDFFSTALLLLHV